MVVIIDGVLIKEVRESIEYGQSVMGLAEERHNLSYEKRKSKIESLPARSFVSGFSNTKCFPFIDDDESWDIDDYLISATPHHGDEIIGQIVGKFKNKIGATIVEILNISHYSNPFYYGFSRSERFNTLLFAPASRLTDFEVCVSLPVYFPYNNSHYFVDPIQVKARLIVDYGARCLACNVPFSDNYAPVSLDHVVPQSWVLDKYCNDNNDRYANFQPLCLHCNQSKGKKFVDYRKYRQEKRIKTITQ